VTGTSTRVSQGFPGLGNKGTKEKIEGNKGTVNLFYGKGERYLYKLEDENILI